MGQQSSSLPTSPICPLQGHSCMRKLALDLECLIIVQNHQEQQVAGHTSNHLHLRADYAPKR